MGAANGKPVVPAQPAALEVDAASAYRSGLPNSGFEACSLDGWTVLDGDAFVPRAISQARDAGGYPYFGAQRMPDRCHYAGRQAPGGDAAMGAMRSATFVLGGDGRINFLLAGGRDPQRLYLTLVRASDGRELLKATGIDFEQYQRVFWDASAWKGEALYLKAVDRSPQGHLNLDSINVPVARLVN
jgi:hypothetical protein